MNMHTCVTQISLCFVRTLWLVGSKRIIKQIDVWLQSIIEQRMLKFSANSGD